MADNGQYQMGDSGFVIGHATDYLVEQVSGLYEMPALKFGTATNLDNPRLDADGDFPSDFDPGPRVMTFQIHVLTDNYMAANPSRTVIEASNANLRALSHGWSYSRGESGAKDLLIAKPFTGNWRIRKARVTKYAFPSSADQAMGDAKGAIEVRSSDPNIYSDDPSGFHSATLDPAGPTTSVVVTNSGSGIIYPVFLYNGSGGTSLAPPQIEASDGTFLNLAANFVDPFSDIPMVFDTRARTVIAHDGTRKDLLLTLTSSWHGFATYPGESNTMTVSGTGPWTVEWYDTELAL